jgi:biopolymer transport protein ExbD
MKFLGGPFKKSKFKRSSPMNDEMALQITSMADIFMILLVFLLKSYSTALVNVTPTAGMKLPVANAESPELNALKVEISETAVSIEGNPAMTLDGFKVATGDVGTNGVSKTLAEAFEKERKRQLLIAQSNSDVKVDPKVIVVADQRAPYSTIKAVLASAAIQGYTDFKLAVVKRE